MKKTICTLFILLMFCSLYSGTYSTSYAADDGWSEYVHSLSGLTAGPRIRLHYRMAQDYYNAYELLTTGEDVVYPSWTLAENAEYWSPYFTNYKTIPLESMDEIILSATLEASAYRVMFPDWGPVEFNCWPSLQGFVMRTKFQGTHRVTGEVMSFYTHGYVYTNLKGEIIRWETWPEPYAYDQFLQVAIGDSGPWEDSCQYYNAILLFLKSVGADVDLIEGCPPHE